MCLCMCECVLQPGPLDLPKLLCKNSQNVAMAVIQVEDGG